MGTIGGNLCQRPRCWYFRRGVPCLKNGGTNCPAREAGGENQYLAILDAGPCYIVHPSDPAVALTALDAELELTGGEDTRTVPITAFYALPRDRVDQETTLRPGEVDGAFLLSPSLRLNYSALTIKLAQHARLPVQAHRKEWVKQGALFSYGADLGPIGRAVARYVDSILRGTPPAKLPVEEVPTVEFAINLKFRGRADIPISPIGSTRAGGGGSYLHMRRAVSHTLSSLRLSSSMERSFPTIEEAKPH